MTQKMYVYSTLATDVKYGPYHKTGSDIPEREEHVLIRGKAGITTERLITPKGTATPVTVEQLAMCEADPVFQMHKKNGFIVVDDADLDADMMADSMERDNGSAPLTTDDFKEEPAEGTTRITPIAPPPKKR